MLMDLTQDNFNETIGGERVVLVDFWAPWCGPCKIQTPILEELAKELEGAVVIGKVNADNQPEICMEYGIMGIPTMILFLDGEPVFKHVGVQAADTLRAKISEFSGALYNEAAGSMDDESED
jgi:thioredoxin 1